MTRTIRVDVADKDINKALFSPEKEAPDLSRCNTIRSQVSGKGYSPGRWMMLQMMVVPAMDAPDGGAISRLRCLLGYTRYRSGNREHRMKNKQPGRIALIRMPRNRNRADDAVLIQNGAQEASSASV